MLLFLFVLYAGVYGTPVAEHNRAPVLTWTIWWAGIIFAILFLGKAWCTVCPWDAMASWFQRLTSWRRVPNEDRFTLDHG